MSTANAKRIKKKEGGEKKPKFGTVPKITPHKAAIGILIIIIAYAALFFFLKNKLLFTPDIDRSDAFHFNISLKHYLWQNVQNWRLPFWSEKLQGGFPLLAEGQIGALYLPNLLILRFFDFVAGYNLLFVSSLLLLTAGMYLLLLEFSVPHLLATLLSFLFTFNGAITFRWIHLNVIQTFSLTPFIFYAYIKWLKSKHISHALLLIFLITQMLFAGHLQISFIVIFGLLCWHVVTARKDTVKLLFIMASSTVLALPQLIPTFMLSQYSSRNILGGYEFSTLYSLPPQHLLSFITPYFFGNARFGTYPDSINQWGLFWENTPYTGLLFFLVFIAVYTHLFIKRKLTFQIHASMGLAAFFVLLALGKNSPLYFLFDLPPFNIFRTPPKYLLMAVFFLVLSFGFIIQQYNTALRSRLLKIVICCALFVNTAHLIFTAFSYHLFIPSSVALAKPPVSRWIKENDRYVSFGFSKMWHDFFTKKGWRTEKDVSTYLFFNNFLIPNSNLLYGYDAYDVNTGGLRLRRSDYMTASINAAITGTGQGASYISSNSAVPFLSLNSISTILSSYPISNNELKKQGELKSGSNTIFIYKTAVNDNKPYYIPRTITNIKYLDELLAIHKTGAISTSSAIIEDYKTTIQNVVQPSLTFSKKGSKTIVSGKFPQSTFLVLKTNWYPELEVLIDGKKAKTYKTNLVHIGLLVPKGEHTILLSYRPLFFIYGVIIAGFYTVAAAALYLKFLKK